MFKVRQFLPVCTNCFRRSRLNINNFKKSFSSANNTNQDFSDGPIKYSVSPASKYKAKTTRTGVQEERLWYEPYVIMASISVFLLYFCVFREENDIDKELNTSLYSRISGLEEYQLRLSLKYNQDRGEDTLHIRKRLEEIEQGKQKGNVSISSDGVANTGKSISKSDIMVYDLMSENDNNNMDFSTLESTSSDIQQDHDREDPREEHQKQSTEKENLQLKMEEVPPRALPKRAMFNETRRRPATVVKALTTSELSDKYNRLVNRRLEIAEMQKKVLEDQHEESLLKRKLLETQIKNEEKKFREQ